MTPGSDPDAIPPARKAEWLIVKLALGLGMAIVAVLAVVSLTIRGEADQANDQAIRAVVGHTITAARSDGREAFLKLDDGSTVRIRGGSYGIGVRTQGGGR